MPYHLELGSGGHSFGGKAIVVNSKTGEHKSLHPIPLENAEAQMRVLERVAEKEDAPKPRRVIKVKKEVHKKGEEAQEAHRGGVSLEELHEFAKYASPGGNKYDDQKIVERVWGSPRGRALLKIEDDAGHSDSFRAYHLIKKIWGLMSNRYSGVFENFSVASYGEPSSRPVEVAFFKALGQLPNDYKIYIEKEAAIMRKDDEPLHNMDAIGSDDYDSIPDEVRRPDTKYDSLAEVREALSGSLADYKALRARREGKIKAEKEAKEKTEADKRALYELQFKWIEKHGSRDDIYNWVSSENDEDTYKVRGSASKKTLMVLAREFLLPKEFKRYASADTKSFPG